MTTSVVSGRVDDYVKLRADGYIRTAGLTVGDVIKAVWEHIAKTGEVPAGDSCERGEAKGASAWDEFMEARDSLPSATWLATMTGAQMKDMVARRYV